MKIQIGDTDYSVRDLTILQYETLKDREDISDIDFICLMTGVDKNILKQTKMTDIIFVSNFLRSEVVFQDEVGELELTLEIDGTLYGLIKPSELTFDEFINLEIFMAEKPLDLPKIATHLYRPLKDEYIGEKRNLVDYDLQSCLDRTETFKKHFPIKKLMSALFFLISFGKILTEDLLVSMETMKIEVEQSRTQQ
jgi:hypothetical protein